MNPRLRILMPAALIFFLAAPLRSQQNLDTVSGRDFSSSMEKHLAMSGKVTDLQGEPIRFATVQVRLTSANGDIRNLQTNFQGDFVTNFWINTDRSKNLVVEVMVTRKGFHKAHRVINIADADSAHAIPVTLLPTEEDSKLLSREDLISSLAPRLKTLGPSDGLSPSGEKDYARGVSEFLDQDRPDRALQYFNKVATRDPGCLECFAMLGLAELGSGDWDGAKRNFGEAVTRILSKQAVGRPEPLTAYAVMVAWGNKPKEAAGYLVEAVKLAPKDGLALEELGRTQLLLENWDAATYYLAQAIAAGAGPEARFLRVQALLGDSKYQEANQEFTAYLGGRDIRKMPPPVRLVWSRIQERQKLEVYAKAQSPVLTRPILDYMHAVPELEGLQPATDQMPLEAILSELGKNVAQYFKKFPNTTSLEEIHEEKLNRKGKVGSTLEQKFHYLCVVPPESPGSGFDEYRTNMSGGPGTSAGLQDGYMLTSGFASASLLFLPSFQPGSSFRYLGRQKVDGREAHVVAFTQNPMTAKLNGVFKSNGESMPTFSQGLVWVDAGSYAVVRLRTDLLAPLEKFRLERETTEIEYAETRFKGIDEPFWLPRAVTVTVDWDGRVLRNTHQYSGFKLFNVGSEQKIEKLDEKGKQAQ